MAVVVQEMVEADAAGVLFTANPANGRRHEAVVSAAWGLGESVVGGTVDTDQLVVRRPDGPVLSRTTADKTVMTVYVDEGTAEREVPTGRRHVPVLDDGAAVELTRLGGRVEAHFGTPQDIEWVRREGTFLLVQARPVTVLPPPEADPPTDWSVPDHRAFYVRASITEQLPDPLTPLFADLVKTSVARSLQALFREFVGEDVVRDGDVDLPTVNGYAYYRYGLAGLVRVLLHSGKAYRALLTPGSGGTEHRWRTYAHPRYVETVRAAEAQAARERPLGSLVETVRTLLDAGTEYYTAGPDGHPARGGQRDPAHPVLRPARAARRRPGRGDLRAGLRQPPDPGREVALGPRRLVTGTSRARRGADRDTARRAGLRTRRAGRRGGRRPRRVAPPVPGAPRGVRAPRLQPRPRERCAGRGAGSARGDAAVLPAR